MSSLRSGEQGIVLRPGDREENLKSRMALRLALLNALVVISIVALIAGTTYLITQRLLQDELDQSLQDRASSATLAWNQEIAAGAPFAIPSSYAVNILPTPTPSTGSGDREEPGDGDDGDDGKEIGEDRHETEEDEAIRLQEGNTLLYVLSPDYELLATTSTVSQPGLPDLSSAGAAMAAGSETRTVSLHGAQNRIYSTAVYEGEDLAGVVQAVQDISRLNDEKRKILLVSLAAIAIGGLLAIPAGLFLARRAIRPLELAYTRQRQFVADASHELRTPLSILRANAEVMLRQPETISPETAADLSSMVSEIDEMSALIDGLLLAARLDAGTLALQREPVDVATLMESVQQEFLPIVASRNIAIINAAGQPIAVMTDPLVLRRTLRILVDNAIKYTQPGGTVTVETRLAGNSALLTVDDNGPGITPEDQAHIFDRFYRGEKDRSRDTGGAGLGLSIAYAAVTELGGHLELSSTPGRGTTVTVSLPLR